MSSRPAANPTVIAGAGVLACVLMTGLFAAAIVLPAWRDRDDHAKLRQELAGAQKKASGLSADVYRADQALANLQRSLESQPLALEPVDALNKRLSDLTAFCKTCNLEIQDLNPGSPMSGAKFSTVPIRLTGHGDYGSCMAFLHELHQHYLDVAVMNFRLSGNPQEHATPLSAEFDLCWYAKPAELASNQ